MNLSLTRLQSYLLLLVIVLAAGTAGMMAAEDLSPFEAFYFIVVTIATVGYGDISPATTAGRALVIVLIVA
ncbi:MAG: potassium channel family protein, partial [Methanomicrobiaceae archaeon]|nr:potassium channel family protein [Methanomicrobiaceae archaeon]